MLLQLGQRRKQVIGRVASQSKGNNVFPSSESISGLKIPSPLELLVMIRMPSPFWRKQSARCLQPSS